MQFKTNIKLIEVKIAKAVGILNKLRFCFPKTTLLLLYYPLVHPHLQYALPVWGAAPFHPTLENYSVSKIKLFVLSSIVID